MKSAKIKIDPENVEAKEALEKGTTTLFTMGVVLHNGGLGLCFNCDSATMEAYEMFMPKGWLLHFMERVAAAVADNKKMYKLMRQGTNEIVAGFDKMRPDLKMEGGELSVDQQSD